MSDNNGKKIEETISEKQKAAMEGFVKMMGPVFGEENCQKWYQEFLKKDASVLDEYKQKRGDG